MQQNTQTQQRDSFKSFDSLTLIIANALSVVFFLIGNGAILQALWIYWLQSVIIGVINVVRIITIPGPAQIVSKSGHEMLLGRVGRAFLALFFTIHYGMFHLVYGVFLFVFSMEGIWIVNGVPHQTIFTANEQAVNIFAVLAAGAAFAVHHFIAFKHERSKRKPVTIWDMGKVMGRPYARIIPMHMIILLAPFIVLGLGTIWVFIIFMVLKTCADLILHTKGTGHVYAKTL